MVPPLKKRSCTTYSTAVQQGIETTLPPLKKRNCTAYSTAVQPVRNKDNSIPLNKTGLYRLLHRRPRQFQEETGLINTCVYHDSCKRWPIAFRSWPHPSSAAWFWFRPPFPPRAASVSPPPAPAYRAIIQAFHNMYIFSSPPLLPRKNFIVYPRPGRATACRPVARNNKTKSVRLPFIIAKRLPTTYHRSLQYWLPQHHRAWTAAAVRSSDMPFARGDLM